MKTSDVKTIPLLATIALLCGCQTYSHQRVAADGTKETTTLNAFLFKSDASKVRSVVKDGAYSRTVSLGTISQEPDKEAIAIIVETAISTAIKAAGKP